jgi:hypothetical protein
VDQAKEVTMKRILFGLAALAGVVLVSPASAEGLRFDAPGVHVGVGDRGYYRDDDWRWRHGYHAYGRGDCRDVTVERRRWDGSVVVRHIRRCD